MIAKSHEMVLLALKRKPRSTTRQIARDCGLSTDAADQWIGTAIYHGHVTQHARPAGGLRIATFSITPAGEAKAKELLP